MLTQGLKLRLICHSQKITYLRKMRILNIRCLIDVFSKMAWVYPILEKKYETVLLCFKDILKKCGQKPQRVQTDRGTEFNCKTWKNISKMNDF